MIVYRFLDILDKKRHRNLNEYLENQFIFGNNNNPDDVQVANENTTNYNKFKLKNNSKNRRGCKGLSFATRRGHWNNNNSINEK